MSIRSELCRRERDFLLFPWVHRLLWLPSRVVMSPGCVSPTGESSELCARAAEQGVGLVLAEGVFPLGASGELRPLGGRALRAWKQWLRALHRSACRVAAGVALTLPPGENHSAVQRMAELAASAAVDARRLGFDALELQPQGASALSPEVGRMLSRVMHALRRAVGSRFPLLLRLPADGGAAAELLPTELDMVACAAGTSPDAAAALRSRTGRAVMLSSAGAPLPWLTRHLRDGGVDLVLVHDVAELQRLLR